MIDNFSDRGRGGDSRPGPKYTMMPKVCFIHRT